MHSGGQVGMREPLGRPIHVPISDVAEVIEFFVNVKEHATLRLCGVFELFIEWAEDPWSGVACGGVVSVFICVCAFSGFRGGCLG